VPADLPRNLTGSIAAAVRSFWRTRAPAALNTGRNSIGVDIDPEYCRMALRRLDSESGPLFAQAAIEYRTAADLLAPASVPAVADAPQRRPARIRGARRGPNEDGNKMSPKSPAAGDDKSQK